MPESKKKLKERAGQIVSALKKAYPGSCCTLDFRTPHELLVATILSAQCTDERVNVVTKDLFRKFRKPKDFAEVEISELEEDIRSTGFFRNKARSIKGSAEEIVDKYGGKTPESMERLVKLPGVGRKTASVILGTAFGKAEGIVVDTHVKRLSGRLGLSKQSNPDKIEKDLMEIIRPQDWIKLSHMLIDHGRAVCKARKPDCKNCRISKLCPSAGKI